MDLLKAACLSSSIRVCNSYRDLAFLVFEDMQDTDEYAAIIAELKAHLDEEYQAYIKIDEKEMTRLISECDEIPKDAYSIRYLDQLLLQLNRLQCDKDMFINGFLMASVITAKLMIDVIKLVDKNIKSSATDGNQTAMGKSLLAYHNLSKFNYLSDNEYLEHLSVLANFNIEAIPSYNYSDIKLSDTGKIYFQKSLKNNLTYRAKSIITTIMLSEEDPHNEEDVYKRLLLITEFDLIMKYLDKSNLNALIKHYNDCVKKAKNSLSSKALTKSLAKRREEFQSKSY